MSPWINRSWRRVRGLLPSIIACCAWGCSVNPSLHISEFGEDLPEAALVAVPFYPQSEFQCGPAALATVLGASGVEVSPSQLTSQVFIPERRGSLQVELVAATRSRGRIPFYMDVSVRGLLEELAAGRAVLVMQNLGTRETPLWHYAVLSGYERTRNQFRLNSGKRKDLWLPASEFMRTWDWAGRWAILTLVPGEYPVRAAQSADPSSYMRPVADFEKVAGSAAAEPAWRAAARLWPAASLPYLALGNSAYGAGKLETAIRWYAQGVASSGNDQALANNLASVLGEAGCARAGERVLAKHIDGLAPDSPWAGIVQATVVELARQRGPDDGRCDALLHGPPL